MPHQCVHCGKICSAGSKEILTGCDSCSGKFFFYVRDEQIDKFKQSTIQIPQKEKKKIEKDIRDIAGITKEDKPVILDIESIRVTGEGKFEIDVVNLFKKNRPLVYKLEEGKYIIDLSSNPDKIKL
jgi:predicted  nucleic acid-binding Zn-ribbon protein